ncbi:hypothetical protein EZ449_15335 [Pedobacter frigidisoli]|uniref:Immunity protein 26 n=1 Tax=Pedobacter frigidisoli TaxID=2530455 RepID=A0A4R0NWM6_9SPHI|nr:hypothetical protein [Pedobacter frigidisoli]TCD05836.1 hypothetical protein EZ449_15335 [Pedobacter frigidisoli]
MDVHYFKLPLGNIPFKEITSLEDINYTYVYCSYFSLKPFKGLDYYLLSVYNVFEPTDIGEIDDGNLLFGRVISEEPSKRGVNKVIQVKTEKRAVDEKDLPHLKYSNSKHTDGNWFYVKDGDYFAFSGIESSFDKVAHLEGISIYGEIILRLRIVIELLKKNIKKGLAEISVKEFNEIAFNILRSEPSTKKISDEDIQYGVNNWLPSMLMMPLFEEVPDIHKERVKDKKK